jgi:hypothetical protein
MTPTSAIKVSVLIDGTVLLDGQRTTVDELTDVLARADKSSTAVWYYRENAGQEPPPIAVEVLKLITTNKLPVRLSSKPDFSDAVTRSNPLSSAFASIRARAAQNYLVVLRPDGQVSSIPAMKKETMPAQAIASMEKMLPASTKRNVAVVAETAWAQASAPDVKAANTAIPFFGLLMGFATIGHAVWVFKTTRLEMLVEGAREADVLIVDGVTAAVLPAGWLDAVRPSMRNPQILIHDRETFQLRKA